MIPSAHTIRTVVRLLPAVGGCLAGPLTAQPTRADPVDVQGWYGTSLTLDLPNKWASEIGYRVRYQNDAATWLGSYLTTELSRGLGKGWRFGGSYRLANVGDAVYHRIAAGPSWEQRLLGFRVNGRVLAQYQRQTFEGNDEGSSDTDRFLRTRLQLQRPITSWLRGYASTEPYWAIGGAFPVDNWRNTLGTEWDLGKGRALDLYYIYRPDYGKRSYNRTFHVIGVELELGWKPFRKRSGPSAAGAKGPGT